MPINLFFLQTKYMLPNDLNIPETTLMLYVDCNC